MNFVPVLAKEIQLKHMAPVIDIVVSGVLLCLPPLNKTLFIGS